MNRPPMQNLLLDVPVNDLLVQSFDELRVELGAHCPLKTLLEHRGDSFGGRDGLFIGLELHCGLGRHCLCRSRADQDRRRSQRRQAATACPKLQGKRRVLRGRSKLSHDCAMSLDPQRRLSTSSPSCASALQTPLADLVRSDAISHWSNKRSVYFQRKMASRQRT